MNFPFSVKILEGSLPHHPPAIWVDEVLWIQEGKGACAVRYNSAARYAVAGNQLSETCFVEWMAQSYGFVQAAHLLERGLDFKMAKDAFLAAIREFQIYEHPEKFSEGALFEIEVRETHQLGPLTLIEGKVFFEKKLIASAQLKVFSR